MGLVVRILHNLTSDSIAGSHAENLLSFEIEKGSEDNQAARRGPKHRGDDLVPWAEFSGLRMYCQRKPGLRLRLPAQVRASEGQFYLWAHRSHPPLFLGALLSRGAVQVTSGDGNSSS